MSRAGLGKKKFSWKVLTKKQSGVQRIVGQFCLYIIINLYFSERVCTPDGLGRPGRGLPSPSGDPSRP